MASRLTDDLAVTLLINALSITMCEEFETRLVGLARIEQAQPQRSTRRNWLEGPPPRARRAYHRLRGLGWEAAELTPMTHPYYFGKNVRR